MTEHINKGSESTEKGMAVLGRAEEQPTVINFSTNITMNTEISLSKIVNNISLVLQRKFLQWSVNKMRNFIFDRLFVFA